jgi:hypothetical protein
MNNDSEVERKKEEEKKKNKKYVKNNIDMFIFRAVISIIEL